MVFARLEMLIGYVSFWFSWTLENSSRALTLPELVPEILMSTICGRVALPKLSKRE